MHLNARSNLLSRKDLVIPSSNSYQTNTGLPKLSDQNCTLNVEENCIDFQEAMMQQLPKNLRLLALDTDDYSSMKSWARTKNCRFDSSQDHSKESTQNGPKQIFDFFVGNLSFQIEMYYLKLDVIC